MSKDAGFFNFSLSNILSDEQSALDQARIRLLYYGFFILLVTVSGLFFSVYLQHLPLLSITSAITLGAIIVLYKYLTYRPDWRGVSHALLAIATLINLSNVFIIIQKVDIIAIQVILLAVLFSYYMLGQRWGLFYSLINIIPVLAFYVITYNQAYFISLKPEELDQSTVIISMFANFIIIIYIHSHFYSAFIKNIKELRQTSEDQAILNSKLELAIEKAEKSSQVKSEFLATMSHEIRTPLNAIVGMSNLMIMANPRPDQKENLNVLKSSANNLQSIVNDVLDFNKIEAGKVMFESIKFNLDDLLENLCTSQKAKAEAKGLNFTLKVDPMLKGRVLYGDPTRLNQVLFNLVSNAIKFTRQGNVYVKAFCYEDRNNKLRITFTVKDTGIGIDKDNLQSIFEPFTQESITTTRQYGGTGMGLAIVKRLLELQGLQMHVSSKLGEGSEFSFNMEFPVSEASINEIGENHPLLHNAGALSSLRVLIAEDNPVNVLLMKKLLSKWKIVPTIAENGEKAIETFKNGDFDIILMDLQMPVMNGFDAAMEIRKLPDAGKANVPIIALTAAALLDIEEQVLNAGMNDYVSKPFKPEQLMEKIQTLIFAGSNQIVA
ncbi:response regulator [Mucilaginibacter sp. L3T2-6]|uniref:response regulator n=1 Tax=Mucilaginibacter sp. L3T2-6 TaxID=3062491 RepID=UPI002674EABA|nr:response regulator [Mucilaginibacter sp. L3T2-6]MDO3642531.1 response regulator [Mucilaginibacter sp. L3T2-6]MDV6215073.1 response regulator [Mucilaginibacter sp. L3T2-6]